MSRLTTVATGRPATLVRLFAVTLVCVSLIVPAVAAAPSGRR